MCGFEQVTIHSGPKLDKLMTFGPPPAKFMKWEYGGLECAIEVVESVDKAVEHVLSYGSGHTDVIVTKNGT
jgi:delta-1-pyrroline-5-carboxylate synthetase